MAGRVCLQCEESDRCMTQVSQIPCYHAMVDLRGLSIVDVHKLNDSSHMLGIKNNCGAVENLMQLCRQPQVTTTKGTLSVSLKVYFI